MTTDDLLQFVKAAVRPDPAKLLDALLEFSGAERGFLVLRQGANLTVRTARNMEGGEVDQARGRVSRTLLERALSEGKPLLASDADVSSIESVQRQKVRAVCVLPLRTSGGAVYLDHQREGAFRDLEGLDDLSTALDEALRDSLELAELRLRDREAYGDIIGRSKPMRELFRLIERVAAAPYPALLFGETGTGKELVARAIHRQGPRAAGPFVAANCASLPDQIVDRELFGHVRGAYTSAERDRPGLFAQAHGGILFLDEIACLSSAAQESFLRVLETGEVRRVGDTKTETVDVRIVAATNEDLEISDTFRRDLLYRLNVLRIDLPPLRERREDVPLLIARFLDRIARETGQPRKNLSKSALAVLVEHPWPGNVRQLENGLRRATSLTDRETLEAADLAFLKERPRVDPAGDGDIVAIEEHIRGVLVQWGDRMELREIAERLGVSRKTLWEKKKKFGL